MTETRLRSITNSGRWMLILSPTYSTRSLSVRPHNNIRCSLCHRYVTCPRFDRRYPIPSSISLPASLFTRSVIHHLATNSLVAMLARLYVMCITEKALRYLSDNRSEKSSSRNTPTQYVPSETPVEHLYNHPVTL